MAEPLARPEPPTAHSLYWLLWLTAAALAALIAWMMARQTQDVQDEADAEPLTADLPRQEATHGEAASLPPPPITGPPLPAPSRPPVPQIAAPAHPAIAFLPLGARASLVGWTIPYRLRLHNPGGATMADMRLRLMMTNVDDGHRRRIEAFLSGHDAMAAHAVPALDPGVTIEIAGDLRIAHQAIVPVQVGGRALLIPLVTVHAQAGADAGAAACFLLGQENARAPGGRMAPFQLDNGPRQYHALGCRQVPLPTALPAFPLFRHPQPA